MTRRRRIAYLCLTVPHDDLPDVKAAFARHDADVEVVKLAEAGDTDWDGIDLLSLRMLRYFHLEPDLVPRINSLCAEVKANVPGGLPVVNPPELVAEGLDKLDYLPRLADAGVPIVPTEWVPRGTPTTLRAVLDRTGWRRAVVKPTLSARGWNAFRVTRVGHQVDDPDPAADHPHFTLPDHPEAATDSTAERRFAELTAMTTVSVQPFVDEITTRGETSFVFIGGTFSHAIAKTVAENGWIAHESFGGVNTRTDAAPAQVAWAEELYGLLCSWFGQLRYARIDTLPAPHGGLQLLECELVAPRLFLREGDALDRYARSMLEAARNGLV
jgi:glutathione synthase/RimK-type ligase-like ATP-grasp enzyme